MRNVSQAAMKLVSHAVQGSGPATTQGTFNHFPRGAVARTLGHEGLQRRQWNDGVILAIIREIMSRRAPEVDEGRGGREVKEKRIVRLKIREVRRPGRGWEPSGPRTDSRDR